NKLTGFSISKLSQTLYDRLLKINENLHKKIIGQNYVILKIIDFLIQRIDKSSGNKPLGIFLFIGPNGVGKKELAKALGFELFNSTQSFISIDMNRYTQSHSTIQLIDDLSNSIDSQEHKQLREIVEVRFNGIILFDQIEKAHLEIFDILSEILNNVSFIDSNNRIINIKNTIIIFTSNIGEEFILQNKKYLPSTTTENYYGKLSQIAALIFPRQFLNSLNNILLFQSLNKSHYYCIIDREIELLQERLRERDIQINLTDALIEHILNKFYYLGHGIPLLKKYITTELWKLIIDMKILRNYRVTIDIDHNQQHQFQIQQLSSTFHSSRIHKRLNQRSTLKTDNIFNDNDDDKDFCGPSSKCKRKR
ncbi:unnamed protein product, partial [Rotaria sordida]